MSKQLSPEQVIRIAVREGIKAAQQQLEFERNKQHKLIKDNRLHNTKLLIQDYRLFKSHAEKALYTAQDIDDDESVFDILSLMSDKAFTAAENTAEAIKQSAVKTQIMVKHVSAMIEIYRVWCERTGKPENMRQYRVLCALYIDDTPKTVDEIAAAENIDRRTVYRDINAALDILSALIFGIDSLHEQ